MSEAVDAKIYILQELGFGCGRVTDDTDVDVATKVHTFGGDLVYTTHKLEEKTLLNDLMTIDGRRDTLY